MNDRFGSKAAAQLKISEKLVVWKEIYNSDLGLPHHTGGAVQGKSTVKEEKQVA